VKITTYEFILLTKSHEDRAKTVDFLIIVNILAISLVFLASPYLISIDFENFARAFSLKTFSNLFVYVWLVKQQIEIKNNVQKYNFERKKKILKPPKNLLKASIKNKLKSQLSNLKFQISNSKYRCNQQLSQELFFIFYHLFIFSC